MTYQRSADYPTERYSKKVTLYVQLPDGKTQTRKTKHVYQFVTAVNTPNWKTGVMEWGILSWHHTRKAAEDKLQNFRSHAPGRQSVIITVLENKPEPLLSAPEPSDFEKARDAFLAAPPAETAKPSLEFPEPTPGKTFIVYKRGSRTWHFAFYQDGKHTHGFYRTNEITARSAVKRYMGLGYALTSDRYGLVSPLCTYNPHNPEVNHETN